MTPQTEIYPFTVPEMTLAPMTCALEKDVVELASFEMAFC